MKKLGRRLVSIPVVLIALPVLVILSPVWLVVGTLVDLIGGLRRLPTIRLMAFAIVYLAHEWAGLFLAVVLGVRQAASRRHNSFEQRTVPYRRVQAWWSNSLLTWAGRLLSVRFEMPDPHTLPAGDFILLSRHASMVDALLPAIVITKRLDRFVHYILKRELQWDPNLDVFGHRLGNYFVSRSGDGDQQAAAIARFAGKALPNSALVIFPEGTYATSKSRARVVASLEKKGETEVASYARTLNHLLPPKPAGTLSLLETRPDLDVVVFGHFGLEGVAELAGLRRRLPLRDPIRIEWWHHPRDEVPTDPDKQVDWLNETWRTLDHWVRSISESRELDSRSDPERPPTNTTGENQR